MPVSLPFTLSLMIVTFVLGLTGGYILSPTYTQSMYQKEEMGLGTADKYVDLRYLNAMATHHRGAILLANQISDKTVRPEIKTLATDIQTNEPKSIASLYEYKNAWYADDSRVKDPIVANIGAGIDQQTDLRFLNALIAHHEEGINMTREIRTKSSRAETLSDADAVEKFLSTSLVTLKDWRKEWYGVE